MNIHTSTGIRAGIHWEGGSMEVWSMLCKRVNWHLRFYQRRKFDCKPGVGLVLNTKHINYSKVEGNSVPAAAVKQSRQALFMCTGLKEYVGGFIIKKAWLQCLCIDTMYFLQYLARDMYRLMESNVERTKVQIYWVTPEAKAINQTYSDSEIRN